MGGGADPLVRAGRARPASGATWPATCKVRVGRRGLRPRTRGSAPQLLRSTEDLLPHRDAFNEIEIDLVAETGSVAQRNGAVRRGFDGGRDDVPLPVTLAGGDVAGEHEVGQAGEGDVVGAPDAGLQHAAAPDRNAGCLGDIVHAFGLAESGDAAELDVDDAAGV